MITKSSTLHWSARTFASQRLSSAAQQTYLNQVLILLLYSKAMQGSLQVFIPPSDVASGRRRGWPPFEWIQGQRRNSIRSRLKASRWGLKAAFFKWDWGSSDPPEKQDKKGWQRQKGLNCTRVTNFADHNPATWCRLVPRACHKEVQNESGPELYEPEKSNRRTQKNTKPASSFKRLPKAPSWAHRPRKCSTKWCGNSPNVERSNKTWIMIKP